MSRQVWSLSLVLVLTLTATAQAQSTETGSTDERAVDRTRRLFPVTEHWFRLVADAQYAELSRGRRAPDYDALTHDRVRRADNAGRSILPIFPASFAGALRVGNVADPRHWLEITPVAGRDVAIEIQDGMVVYEGAYRDTDVLYKATPTHLDEYLLVTSREAPSRWAYRIRRGPGIARLRRAGAGLEAVDANGVAWLRASVPVAIDARGTRTEGELRLEGDRIVVSFDFAALELPILVDPDWRATGDMSYGRFYHGANVLPDGRVITTGGCTASVCSGDLTLPACRAVVRHAEVLSLGPRTWSIIASSPVARYFHVAESLSDGDLLLVGGCTDPACHFVTAEVEIFENATSSFRGLPPIAEAVAGSASVRLRDGSILVAGGCTDVGCVARSYVFDPTGESRREIAPMGRARGRAIAEVLSDGRVLVAGGCTTILCEGVIADAELYDPAADRWTAVSPMAVARAGHYSAALLDGRVLVGGGCGEQACTAVHRSAELFDPSSGRFVAAGEMARPRFGVRAVRVTDGSVMVNQGCAGDTDCDLTNELFDPATGAFVSIEPALTARAFHTLLVHPDALVISMGGCQPRTCSWWNETYDIASLRPPPDAGLAPLDAGPPDAAVGPDAAGLDAGRDAGMDAGSDAGPPGDGSSCDCGIARGWRSDVTAMASALVLLGLALRRSHQRRS